MSRLFSLSEIDAVCRKAARGAGYGWGMAEEAGRSARWLAAYGFQGPEALAAWLRTLQPEASLHRPSLQEGIWRAQRNICPLSAGTLASDYESKLFSGETFEFEQVQQPILMLSMVARIVENRECSLIFSLNDHDIVCVAQKIMFSSDFPWETSCADVSVYLTDFETASKQETVEPSAQSRVVDEAAYETLLELAHRTYAPATEASRIAGAGASASAGTTDND
ncbi:DUF3726 domain-containing protein [Granulosicoccus antarcticus]|uniref:DUF3726 domain-containing protein n=1 Tax=Granulosicoccus antarcticus IMCC3135 TaxID=1192854 RepID=A0A2Z2NHJ0_9GAMM|nr:DUF3726 domain-containing protein [Granulosicoccus antarcticus]ASJ70609.1 hypothetical protein IMCC3135_02480 [Granulosicoccus antarcticus IMCC3135]